MSIKDNQDAFMKTFSKMLKEYGCVPRKHPKTVEVEKYLQIMKRAKSMYTSTDDYTNGWQDAITFIETTIGEVDYDKEFD